MLWSLDGIKVFLDISTYCNAGCPQCHRTNENGLGKADWLPLIRWDLKTFQKAFPAEEMKNIESFKFCGTWGDPIMCKEFLEMCKYIIESSDASISVDTNGSIRDSEWWWVLGLMCGGRLTVVFDVDGINQDMHHKYRRFTDLNKVLENMETLSQTRSHARSQTILFKHNQDYKEEIMNLVKSHGSEKHSFVISDRFDGHNIVDNKRFFINENGEEEYLQRADQETLPDGVISSGLQIREHDKQIRCGWALPRNEVLVNPDGQVLPCCYHGNGHYNHKFDQTKGKQIWNHDIYTQEYNAHPEKYNVLHTPLSAIINSDWYRKTLPESMKGDNPVPQCAKYCSNRLKRQHQIRSHHVT